MDQLLLRSALQLFGVPELRQLAADAGLPTREAPREPDVSALERSGLEAPHALEYLHARRVERALKDHRKRRPAIVERLFGESAAEGPAGDRAGGDRAKDGRADDDRPLVLDPYSIDSVRSAPGQAAPPPTFVAIDFETARPDRDSACSVAAVRVENGRVVERQSRLIRPVLRGLYKRPEEQFSRIQSDLHGLTWDDVKDSPCFAEVWAAISPMLDGALFLAAHNAAFDRSVLEASCRSAGLAPPRLPFACTVQLAKACWPLPSARLPVVCRYLGLWLDHHDPLSDATACAQIACAAWGRRPSLFPTPVVSTAQAGRAGGPQKEGPRGAPRGPSRPHAASAFASAYARVRS